METKKSCCLIPD
jgi:ribosomal protein S18 acetylase RimI-like enzyme